MKARAATSMKAWGWLITALLFSLQWIGIRLSGIHLHVKTVVVDLAKMPHLLVAAGR